MEGGVEGVDKLASLDVTGVESSLLCAIGREDRPRCPCRCGAKATPGAERGGPLRLRNGVAKEPEGCRFGMPVVPKARGLNAGKSRRSDASEPPNVVDAGRAVRSGVRPTSGPGSTIGREPTYHRAGLKASIETKDPVKHFHELKSTSEPVVCNIHWKQEVLRARLPGARCLLPAAGQIAQLDASLRT